MILCNAKLHTGDGLTFVVTWATMNSTPASLVEFGLDPHLMNKSQTGTQEVFADGGALQRAEYIHRAVFPTLEAQRRYCK